MVTASAKPEETVYLRGFIGADYDGTSWQAGDAAAFDSAASNWKTDGNGRLAIANLPFLRAAYSGTEPRQMTVQRLHANDAYTFAPYNAYFNDYYTPDGDGAIAGQTTQMIHSTIFRASRPKNCWPPVLTVTPVCWIALKAPMLPMPRRVIWLCRRRGVRCNQGRA